MSAKASGYAKELVVCPNGELISAREKLVLMVLADSHQDKAKRFTYPSLETIAAESRCDRRTCQRYLDALERKGVIRRLRPGNQGSGMMTFYFFPGIESVPDGWLEGGAEGRQDTALFFGRRAAEGRRKGGGRAAIGQLALVERAQEREQEPEQKQEPPLPPSAAADGGAGGVEPPAPDREIDQAADRVMAAIGATARRLRKKVRMVIAQRVSLAERAEEVADRMIAAYEKQAQNSRLLYRVVPAGEFFETGLCWDMNRWNWDQQAVRAQQQRGEASAGMNFG